MSLSLVPHVFSADASFVAGHRIMSQFRFIDPRESGKFIAENADHVKVDASAVTSLSREIVDAMRDGNPFSLSEWRGHELHPHVADDRAIEWIFLIDSLNFSFWSEDASAKYSVNGFTGYWSLCAAVNRSLEDGGTDGDTGRKVDLMDAASYSHLTLPEMERIFRSDDSSIRIPLLEERMEILRENGRILTEVFLSLCDPIDRSSGCRSVFCFVAVRGCTLFHSQTRKLAFFPGILSTDLIARFFRPFSPAEVRRSLQKLRDSRSSFGILSDSTSHRILSLIS